MSKKRSNPCSRYRAGVVNLTGEPLTFPDGTTLAPENYVPQVRYVVDGYIHGAPVMVPTLLEPPPMIEAEALVVVRDEAVMAMKAWVGETVLPRSWLVPRAGENSQ